MLVKSPQKLYNYVIYKNLSWIKASKEHFISFHFENRSTGHPIQSIITYQQCIQCSCFCECSISMMVLCRVEHLAMKCRIYISFDDFSCPFVPLMCCQISGDYPLRAVVHVSLAWVVLEIATWSWRYFCRFRTWGNDENCYFVCIGLDGPVASWWEGKAGKTLVVNKSS